MGGWLLGRGIVGLIENSTPGGKIAHPKSAETKTNDTFFMV
jgi:hypothetical protein